MHWTDRREAQANIGRALAELGWTLHGWHKDQSDSMTDYYHPATWDGVASKQIDGRLAVVVVCDPPLENSGRGPCTGRRRELGPCTACKGTGKEQHDWPGSTMTNILTGEKTTVDAVQAGEPCRDCEGKGDRVEPRTALYEDPWPSFQPNPPHKLWHVELEGRIVASGVGLAACVGYWRQGEKGWQGAMTLAKRMAAAAERPAPPPVLLDHPEVSINEERQGVEIRFPAKPADEVRAALRANGFRWSHFSGCWYKRRSPEAERFAEEIAGGAVAS